MQNTNNHKLFIYKCILRFVKCKTYFFIRQHFFIFFQKISSYTFLRIAKGCFWNCLKLKEPFIFFMTQGPVMLEISCNYLYISCIFHKV